ncbi:fumarylacetoacetate hydrolase family protein [Streptomyces sp. NPDC026672]|uniref:2-keto-4-pentenoate hydratase n=1 Tax=unclassified Streptomyces TaxID=2593676 RepID=UPI0034056570
MASTARTTSPADASPVAVGTHDEGWAVERAAWLLAARRRRILLDPLSDREPLRLDDAYRIQREVHAARLREGEKPAGFKLGYTSKPMREQMGVATPNYGPLTDRMLLPNDSATDPDLLQPRVEPEVGLVLGRRLAGRVTRHEALTAVKYAVACLEVVDSLWADYRFTAEDNTADGSSAAQVVVGPLLPVLPHGLAHTGVVLYRNGVLTSSSAAAAASGNPIDSLVWLVHRLHEEGTGLEAGMLVITGGLTTAVELAPGDVVEADFSPGHRVGVRRSAQTRNARRAEN